jgi:choline dehydrogenase-like flavoprotein
VTEQHADVLIVGAGASGAVTAKHLAENGMRVVCLEQGDWMSRPSMPDYVGDRDTWELAAGKQWNADPNVRALWHDYPCDVEDSDYPIFMYNAVGGTTIYWAGLWTRFLPSDFRVRSLDGVADDWPLSYEELEPFYETVEREFAVSGRAGDPAYPPSAEMPLRSWPINAGGRRMAEALNRLGWHWWPPMQAIASDAYGELNACVRYGPCRMGCPAHAKASVDLTHWPAAIRNGARLVTGARVSEVTVNAAGLATGAVYVDREGRRHHQTADVVILAANGIGTPRLLLLSASQAHPDGLANSSGLVGKRLMMHPQAVITGIYDDEIEDWKGPNGEWLRSYQFYESDPARGFLRGCKWILMPTHGPLTAIGKLETAQDRGTLDAGSPARWDQFWGPGHHRELRRLVGHSMDWIVIGEDLPREENRVTLSDRLTDADGIPAPKVSYRADANARRQLEWHVARASEAHREAGASDVLVLPEFPPAGHLMGTARMGSDRERSVVDDTCRAHDVPNLYIVDGSVFVTCAGVNPTATIAAVARRCAEHLVEHARLQEVPA